VAGVPPSLSGPDDQAFQSYVTSKTDA